MGVLDNILGKLDVVISDIKIGSQSKKPCTEEEKKKMLDILKGYESINSKNIENRPVDFGSVLRVGEEMKQILIKKKVNPTCYLEEQEEKENEPNSLEKGGECNKDEDCKGDLECIGYVKNLTPGKCLNARTDVVNVASLITLGNKCDTQNDCSVGSVCGVNETMLGTEKKCIAFNFPLTDENEMVLDKIVMYPLV